MEDRLILEISEWVAEAGLAGASETELVDGFCRRLVEYGVPLTRVVALIDTLHPVLEARTFHWHRRKNETTASEYARSLARENEDKWLKSPFHYLMESGGKSLRCRFIDGDCPSDRFPVMGELRDEGITDYLAVSTLFGKSMTIGMMDSLVSSWSTDGPDGFDETHITIMERSLPFLALAIRDLRKTPVEDPSVLRDAADSRTRPEAYRMSSDFRARFNGWPIHEPSAGQGA